MLTRVIGVLLIGTVGLVFADEAVAPATGGVPAGAPQPPGLGGMLLPFALMFGVVYFLMIRPQNKKMKEQQKMLGALTSGDEVVTNSGIFGKISGMTEKVVTLEIAQNVKIKVLKTQVSQVLKGQGANELA